MELINFAAVLTFTAQHPLWAGHPYPTCLNWTDNCAARAWLRKAALKSSMARSLQRVLCKMMIDSPVGIKADYIQGVQNKTADSISRVYSNSSTPPSYSSLLAQIPKLRSYARFHPSPELLSLLYSMLLGESNSDPQLPNRLGHFDPGSSSFKIF